MKYQWYKITKHFSGGSNEFQIRVPRDTKLSKSNWDSILEYLGENTSGGHNYGYSIRATRLKQARKNLMVVKYPTYLVPQFIGLGDKKETVVVEELM